MVSSLNYALWCSVVGVPALIWMFEKRSDGWKNRSQTGNSLLLFYWCHPPQKKTFFLQNSSQGVMHDKQRAIRWMLNVEHFLKAVAHKDVVKRALQAEACVCVCVLVCVCVCVCVCVFVLSRVFSNFRVRVNRVKQAPSGKIQVQFWGVDCVVKWHNGTVTLHQNHIGCNGWWWERHGGKKRKRDRGKCCVKRWYTQWYNFLLLLFYGCVTQQNWHDSHWYLRWDLPPPVLHPNDL